MDKTTLSVDTQRSSRPEHLRAFCAPPWRPPPHAEMQIPRPAILALVWGCCAAAAARVDPAALQLLIVLTIFLLIARNLGERRAGPSAYSVFNRGCEPIMGQISAEQFDNEIRHRPVCVFPRPCPAALPRFLPRGLLTFDVFDPAQASG